MLRSESDTILINFGLQYLNENGFCLVTGFRVEIKTHTHAHTHRGYPIRWHINKIVKKFDVNVTQNQMAS